MVFSVIAISSMTLLKRLEGDLGLFSNNIQGLSPKLFEDMPHEISAGL
jgi:hypothetical protein